jgi:sugar transferase (PEP-CTERM/EpsH1 system associated)
MNAVKSVARLPTRRPTTHTMLDAPTLRPALQRVVSTARPSVILGFCTGVTHVLAEPPLRGMPLVLDMVDVDSAKWAALADRSHGPRSWIYAREARLLASFEREIATQAFATLLTTDKECQTLRAIAPEARIDVIQNGVDVELLRPTVGAPDSATVVFCGVMNYEPNEQAAAWLVERVWPKVRQRMPDARLQLVGSSPSRIVRRLQSPADGVSVTGHVPDVRPYLWGAALAVAPLQSGRGVQNKVLEAVAAGLPVVITSLVRDGLPIEILGACDVADHAADFAQAICQVLAQSPAERRTRAAMADVSAMTWDQRLAPLAGILSAAAAS